ncbi:MAG: leucyl aminopeptidase [Thiothrix nivea]|nr:MAG: leucyl aminopeptidase [Thiothrix nivea]
MQYTFQAAVNAAAVDTDCVVVGIYQDGQLSAAAQQLDDSSQGQLKTFLALGDFKGDHNTTQLQYAMTGVKAPRVLLVGLGEQAKMTPERLAQATLGAAQRLKTKKIASVTSFLTDECTGDRSDVVRQAVQAVAEAMYDFSAYKSKKDDTPATLASWTIAHTEAGDFSTEVQRGMAVGAGVALCRDLGNTPGNVCTPTYLAAMAQQLADSSDKTTLDVLDESEMEAMGMGAFVSVSKGSTEPGKMLILQYNGGKQGDAPIALVGKGITFDSGGISLKPGAKMDEMKYDMCGAASVLGSLKAAIAMELPLNLVVVVAAAENMPAGNASKPGDIVTTLSGQTVEILNTDAEGRLVLCDALTYVEKFKPAAVIDVATLTGAAIVALGHHTSGLLSNDDQLAQEILTAGTAANDEAWRLPMGEKYQKQLKSNFADMANIGGPAAGTITAACFLARFTENMTWAHLDIAGTAWQDGAKKGATGRPVPLLTQFLLNRAYPV